VLSLPKSTEFNKRIPKQKFYEKLSVTPAIKKVFTEQIKMIYWRNKIAETTLNLAPGEQVTEIEIFEIRLNSPDLDEGVLRLIDREIPYHIVFLLEYAGKYQAWTSYKEASFRNIAFKVGIYYHTVWLSGEEMSIRIDGLDLDTVYENFVRQIAGDVLSSGAGSSESLKESVERGENRRGLQRQIEVLEAKMKKERQLNRQMEMNVELKRLRNEVGRIK
jgi:hypothetical protein